LVLVVLVEPQLVLMERKELMAQIHLLLGLLQQSVAAVVVQVAHLVAQEFLGMVNLVVLVAVLQEAMVALQHQGKVMQAVMDYLLLMAAAVVVVLAL
jgi:hypothetical protein